MAEKESVNPTEIKLRVYAIIERDDNILLSNEKVGDFGFTKFPGGGLELGETPIECLKRELKEELEIEGFNYKLFHISETFVQNRFNLLQQVIGIYFLVDLDSNQVDTINLYLEKSKVEEKLTLTNRFWAKKGDLGTLLTFALDIEASQKLTT